MNIITLNNNEYVELDYVLLNAPIYSKGCRSSRDLIRKKNISVENYIYARNEKNEWIITYGKSIKYDKVLLLKSLTETIEELKNGENIKDEKGVMKAPEILNLNEEEKFKDLEGNVIDIEVRGERKVNNIYFKVKDIEKGFDILNLQISLIDIHNSYVEETHYKYFLCKTTPIHKYKNKTKKNLYLTFMGFVRVLNSTLKLSQETIFTGMNWLYNNFNLEKTYNYTISPNQDTIISNVGYVYCVTADTVNHVKIGFWTGKSKSLKSRYATYYGCNATIFKVKTMNARKLEKICHLAFKQHNISNELFDKKYLDEYMNFLKLNKN
jgi:hypothetical protein